MLYDGKLSKNYWGEAVNTAAYIKNHIMSKVLSNKSAFEISTGMKSNVSHFKLFGTEQWHIYPRNCEQKLMQRH